LIYFAAQVPFRKPSSSRCTSLLGFVGECKDIRQCPSLSQLTRRQLKSFACSRGLVTSGLFCCPPIDSTDHNQLSSLTSPTALIGNSNRISSTLVERPNPIALDMVNLIPPSNHHRKPPSNVKPNDKMFNKNRTKTKVKPNRAPIKMHSLNNYSPTSQYEIKHDASAIPTQPINLTSSILFVNDSTQTSTLMGHYLTHHNQFDASKSGWSGPSSLLLAEHSLTHYSPTSDNKEVHYKLPKSTSLFKSIFFLP
jgi:hypothetical protein